MDTLGKKADLLKRYCPSDSFSYLFFSWECGSMYVCGSICTFNEDATKILIINNNIKPWFCIHLFLELTLKKLFNKGSHTLFATAKINFTILLLINFNGICKHWLIVAQLLQTINYVKAVMWKMFCFNGIFWQLTSLRTVIV